MQDTADRFMRELARKVYVTPTSFLELIKAFKGLLQDKRDEILGAKVTRETRIFSQLLLAGNDPHA